MVGISSMLRLVTLAIVAVGMSHAAAVEAGVGSGAVAEKAYVPDAIAGYVFFFFFCTHSQ